MQKWVVVYDISNSKRLQKIGKLMKGYGERIQLSVWEVEAPPIVIDSLHKKIIEIINEDEDFVIYFSICERDWQKRRKYGKLSGLDCEEPPFSIV